MEPSFIVLLVCLVIIFLQDWKYRKILVLLPFFIFFFSCCLIEQPFNMLLPQVALNTSFFLLTIGVLIFYMSLKSKRFLNPFQNYFGFGDLLFYLAVTPLFVLHNYILFFVLSMLFALCLQQILKKIMTHDSVPLAGFSAVLLLIVLIFDKLALVNNIVQI